jgi:hypothetical protein
MKRVTRWCRFGLSAALAVMAGAVAATAQPAPAKDPAHGVWTLNVEKSTFSPGPAPKSGTVRIEAAGPLARKVSVEGVGPDGAAVKWGYSGTIDGKDIPITGTNPEAETVSIRRVARRVVETTFKRGGKVTVVNTSTVSPNGKTLTIVTAGTSASGQKVANTQVFDRKE